MPENRQNQSNAVTISSNGPVDIIEDDMKKMKIESKEDEERETKEYPDRPGEPDCLYYLRTGLCGYGTNCRFNHPPNLAIAKITEHRSELPQREGQPDCGYYLKTGTCKYGPTCKYHHPVDRRGAGQIILNTLGLPVRQEEKSCPYYLRNYTCKFGPACKFNHPEFASTVSVSGPVAVGNVGSSLPTSGISYGGALSAWPASRSSLMASSRVPGPPMYAPFVYPPFQGPVTTQSWNGYMGNLPASHLMGTNLAYSSKNQGEFVTGGQADLLTMTVPHLPERTDQPECRYFMSTGSCKYGLNCKFHHPKEKIAQSAATSLGPHGLPLRPGEDTCAYFNSNGICKFGPACKYNHPFGCFIPASYYFGMSPMPMDHPLHPNHRAVVISSSSETSNAKSSKITEWIQKPDTVEEKKQKISEPKVVEDSHEPVTNQPNAAAATSELSGDKAE